MRDKRSSERVAIFKVNQLGDSIIDLPMMEALVERSGKENILVVTTPIAQEVYDKLLPKENVVCIRREKFNKGWRFPRELWAAWKAIRAFRPEVILIPSDQGNLARLLPFFIPHHQCLAMKNETVKLSKLHSTVAFDLDESMQVNNWNLYRAYCKALGIENPSGRPPRPEASFRAQNMDPGKSQEPFVLIHPGSSRAPTQWSRRRFLELARRLTAKGVAVVWMDEPGEAPSEEERGIRILSRRPLQELAQLMRGANLFIGNNSGPMHLADVLGVPLLILPGPAAQGWDPFWSEHRVMFRDSSLSCQPCETLVNRLQECRNKDEPFACQERIQVDEVLIQAMNLLKETGALLPKAQTN